MIVKVWKSYSTVPLRSLIPLTSVFRKLEGIVSVTNSVVIMKAAIIISSILTIMAADARSVQDCSDGLQRCSPVCGSDGKTYCNMDEFCRWNRTTNIDVVAEGTCEDNLRICLNNAPKNIQAVCGSDGRDYGSDGSVECYKKFQGMPDLHVVKQGSCQMVP